MGRKTLYSASKTVLISQDLFRKSSEKKENRPLTRKIVHCKIYPTAITKRVVSFDSTPKTHVTPVQRKDRQA